MSHKIKQRWYTAAMAERRARTENPLTAATAELIAALVGNGTYELVPARQTVPEYPDDSTADDWMFDGMHGR